MLDSEECSLSMEQRENNTKDDVVEIDCISSPQDVFSTLRWRGGILLVPQPTDDPQDPLNWRQSRKYTLLAILCLSSFSGLASSLANQLGFVAQAELYDKTLTQISYSISSAVAGIAFGPLLLIPFAHVFGRGALIWWSLIGCMASGIWAAKMTNHDDYIPFILSRLFGGMFGSIPSVLGAGTILDIFYLHERGKAFTTFSLSFLMGTVAGPTFGGFIVQRTSWPNEFWWTIGLQAFVIVLGFFFLEETGFTRVGSSIYPHKPEGYLANRIATFFPGTKVTPKQTVGGIARLAIAPFLIGFSPVGLMAGIYTLGFFGWFVTVNTLLTIFLQEPTFIGGYGFTPEGNAAFTFALWFGIFAAQVWGYFVNDRLPLALARRRGGTWKPEYRLHSLWIPSALVMPVGLGIFGATLQYHLHYMVAALGAFMITFAAMTSIPVSINYVVECFRDNPLEVSTIMGVYRLSLGLAVPFFVDPWMAGFHGPGWVFGMAAFFSLLAFSLMVVLMFKGHELRHIRIAALSSDEEGVAIIKNEEPTGEN